MNSKSTYISSVMNIDLYSFVLIGISYVPIYGNVHSAREEASMLIFSHTYVLRTVYITATAKSAIFGSVMKF